MKLPAADSASAQNRCTSGRCGDGPADAGLAGAVGGGDPQPVVSTLCTPPGACRMLPGVVHSHGHTLFEEPAHVYLDIGLDKVPGRACSQAHLQGQLREGRAFDNPCLVFFKAASQRARRVAHRQGNGRLDVSVSR